VAYRICNPDRVRDPVQGNQDQDQVQERASPGLDLAQVSRDQDPAQVSRGLDPAQVSRDQDQVQERASPGLDLAQVSRDQDPAQVSRGLDPAQVSRDLVQASLVLDPRGAGNPDLLARVRRARLEPPATRANTRRARAARVPTRREGQQPARLRNKQ